MLRTRLCDKLGIEVPIIAAPFGPWEQVELPAAEIIRQVMDDAHATIAALAGR